MQCTKTLLICFKPNTGCVNKNNANEECNTEIVWRQNTCDGMGLQSRDRNDAKGWGSPPHPPFTE